MSPIARYIEDVELIPGGAMETLHDDEEGSAGIFKTLCGDTNERITVLVAQHVHYMHRGIPLRHLSFYEFVSLGGYTNSISNDPNA